MRSSSPSRVRAFLGMAVRIIIVTVVFALLTFAVGLFVGIISLVLVNLFGGHVSMAGAYRHFAFPAGIFGLVVAFVGWSPRSASCAVAPSRRADGRADRPSPPKNRGRPLRPPWNEPQFSESRRQSPAD